MTFEMTHCRDLKPENLLCATPSDDSPIKVADWGFSSSIADGKEMKRLVGTRGYLSPEIIAGNNQERYSEAVDMWSVGVITYILLYGHQPFRRYLQIISRCIKISNK